ncbi:MAG TPA: hypothetical protein PLW65_11970 [Pseudomonadota bacterium]|nr:hypothetical protein [Pseudomonadota bacterium]
MKTLFASLCTVMLTMGTMQNQAQAAPGDADEQPRLEILEGGRTPCAVRGDLCPIAGAPTTVANSAASATGAADSLPRFSRVSGAAGYRGSPADSTPWTIEINAALRQSALAGNAIFIITDAEDASAAENEVTALWQAPIRAGMNVAARLMLSPDDGFHAQHTYHISVVQVIRGKQRVLAGGDVRLM